MTNHNYIMERFRLEDASFTDVRGFCVDIQFWRKPAGDHN